MFIIKKKNTTGDAVLEYVLVKTKDFPISITRIMV